MSERLDAAVAELVEALRAELVAGSTATPEQLLSVKDAASRIGISRTTLYDEIRAGRCRSVKVGSRRLVPASAIAEYAR